MILFRVLFFGSPPYLATQSQSWCLAPHTTAAPKPWPSLDALRVTGLPWVHFHLVFLSAVSCRGGNTGPEKMGQLRDPDTDLNGCARTV